MIMYSVQGGIQGGGFAAAKRCRDRLLLLELVPATLLRLTLQLLLGRQACALTHLEVAYSSTLSSL